MPTNFAHITQSDAAMKKYEPVVASNFNAHIILQGKLKDKLGDYTFLRQYIKSVTGLMIEKAGNTVEAGYKTAKFRYDSNEKETFYDVEIAFFNFLDNDSVMVVYNPLVAWSRVKYNPLNGQKTPKTIYADAMLVVEKFNRDDVIFWRRIGHHLFPMGDLPDQPGDYTSHDQQELTLTFNVDYVSDVTNDPRLVG